MNSVSQGTRRLFETRLPDGRVVEAFSDGRRSVIAPGHVPGKEFSARADTLLAALGRPRHSPTDRPIHRWALASTDEHGHLELEWNDEQDSWAKVEEHTPGAVPVTIVEVVLLA